MSVATEVTKLNTNLANSYLAVSNKGGTLPEAMNFDNLSTAISSIGGGSGEINNTSLSVTPTTSSQRLTPSSPYTGFGVVNVSAVTNSIDSNIAAGNIKSGVSILGVEGTLTELNGTTLNVTPTTSAQTLTPTSPNNGFTSVSVSAVTNSIDANITAGNIKKDVQILGVTGTYEGSGATFQLTRFKDDTNTEIGTHFCNFTDGSGNKYKVIILDSQYRESDKAWSSDKTQVTNMPMYTGGTLSTWWYDNAKETATTNTTYILNSKTSTACSHCRSNSFTVNGTTYYGQLPNMREVFEMWINRIQIESMDPTASDEDYSSFNFSSPRNIWSSTQASASNGWFLNSSGSPYYIGKTYDSGIVICPVLEIPIS